MTYELRIDNIVIIACAVFIPSILTLWLVLAHTAEERVIVFLFLIVYIACLIGVVKIVYKKDNRR